MLRMKSNMCNHSQQSNFSVSEQQVNMLSSVFINETCILKTRNDINSEKYLLNMCISFY